MSTILPAALHASSGIDGDGGISRCHGNIVAALIGGTLALFVLGCAMPASPRGSALAKRAGDRAIDAVPRTQVPIRRGNAGA